MYNINNIKQTEINSQSNRKGVQDGQCIKRLWRLLLDAVKTPTRPGRVLVCTLITGACENGSIQTYQCEKSLLSFISVFTKPSYMPTTITFHTFKTGSIDVVKDCLSCFAIDLPSCIYKKGRISSYYDTSPQ